MDPLSLILGGGSILSSLGGLFAGNQGNAQAQADIQKAVEQYISLNVPDPEQQKLELQRYQQTGTLSPQLEQAIKQDPSSFQDIVKNQQYTQAQYRALGQLQSLGEDGGLSLSDKANLQSQLIANASKDKGNRDAISDDFARRGQGGSGMALQAQLAGAQSAGDRDAQARLATLGSARDRALKSISDAGTLAGTLNSQDYQRQSDLAQAQDRINQFNTTNAQSVQQRNVASQNNAQAANLAMKQKISDSNTDLSNKEQQYNKELYQKQYEDQLQKANGVAGAYTGAASAASKAGASTAQGLGSIGSALGQGAATNQSQDNWDTWLDATKKKKQGTLYGGDADPSVGGYA